MMIVKIGGGRDINIDGIAKDLSEIDEKVIVVHGANYFRDSLHKRLGIEKKTIVSVSGYSSVLSDDAMIDSIMMAYSGIRNKRIVESLQKAGINAIGLSGIDGRLIKGKRNNGTKITEGNKIKIVRDCSGKPFEINKELLSILLENGYTPVITIPILDENNYAINSENDDIVALIKERMGAGTVINLIEAPGFLADIDDPGSIIKKISKEEIAAIVAGADGRLKRKMHAIKRLAGSGACRIIISDGRTERPIKDALFGLGTVVE